MSALSPPGGAFAGTVLAAAMAVLGACGGATPRTVAAPSLAELRADARASGDGEEVGRWALAEMLAPGGTAQQAAAARQRLDVIPHQGMWASLARATSDENHGDPRSAAEGYLSALRATVISAHRWSAGSRSVTFSDCARR